MKVVIFCGGLGTRLSEETRLIPKPMVKIGNIPIIEHIMRYFSSLGHNDFILCAGYKQEALKDYFYNYNWRNTDFSIDLSSNKSTDLNKIEKNWHVTIVNTGELTMTGGRLNKVLHLIKDETFLLTYGDGLIDLDIDNTIQVHNKTGAIVTLTATLPSGRFGALKINGDRVEQFVEKPRGDGAFINGGYFVVNTNKIKSYLGGEECVWEEDVLAKIANIGKLSVYKHAGFWQPMDTLRDKEKLDNQTLSGDTPWLRFERMEQELK